MAEQHYDKVLVAGSIPARPIENTHVLYTHPGRIRTLTQRMGWTEFILRPRSSTDERPPSKRQDAGPSPAGGAKVFIDWVRSVFLLAAQPVFMPL